MSLCQLFVFLSLECLYKHFSFSGCIFNDATTGSAGQKFHQAPLHDQPDTTGNVKKGGHPNLEKTNSIVLGI